MKKACNVMYTIGVIFNIIAIVGTALAIIAGAVYLAIPEEIAAEQKITVEAVKADGTKVLIFGIVWFILEVVILILAVVAKKAINNKKKDIVPHIIMIIIGAIGDIFFLLGGIFGIIAENQGN